MTEQWTAAVEAAKERPGVPATVYSPQDAEHLRREAAKHRRQADQLDAQAQATERTTE